MGFEKICDNKISKYMDAARICFEQSLEMIQFLVDYVSFNVFGYRHSEANLTIFQECYYLRSPIWFALILARAITIDELSVFRCVFVARHPGVSGFCCSITLVFASS